MNVLELRFEKGKWRLRARKTRRPHGITAVAKKDALWAAARLCRDTATFAKPISLVVYRLDGTIQEERTYPRSRDPRRSKG